MTREEILKELAELKQQYAQLRSSTCEVYGKNKTTVAGRANGCCVRPAKGNKNETI